MPELSSACDSNVTTLYGLLGFTGKFSTGPRSISLYFGVLNTGASTKASEGTPITALIRAPTPSVAPARKWPRSTAARALVGSASAAAACTGSAAPSSDAALGSGSCGLAGLSATTYLRGRSTLVGWH